MTLESVRAQLAVMLEAPGGVEKARELILHLAMRGAFSEVCGPTPLVTLGELLAEPSLNGISQKPDENPSGIPILRISACTSRSDATIDEWDHKFVKVSDSEASKFRLHRGDLLACRFNGNLRYVGRMSIYLKATGKDQVFPDKLIRFRVRADVVDPAYVRIAFNAPRTRHRIEGFCASTAGNIGISAGNLKTVGIPLPPLPDQRRIVAKVDELMALCDQVERERAERGRLRRSSGEALLERRAAWASVDGASGQSSEFLRQACALVGDATDVSRLRFFLVDLAMSGALLPARSSAGSDRVEVSVAPNLQAPIPSHWRCRAIGTLGADPSNPVQTGPFGAQLHKTEFVASGVPVIAVGNLTDRGFKTDGLYFITESKAKSLSRYDVRAGDVLFARSGATLGKVCVAPDFVDDWRMTGHILRARLNQSIVDPRFVVYALWGARIVREQVLAGVQGSTRPGYNTSLLERIVLPVPPLAEQHRIVERLDELMAICDGLEAKMAAVDRSAEQIGDAIMTGIRGA